MIKTRTSHSYQCPFFVKEDEEEEKEADELKKDRISK